ncbi:hypothetical protein N0V88_004736 [Collariella sp. IMI 366227]|nr:hypothetical protein N0V88_004736 [Collariella sp. IMI 366227]
MMGPRLRIPLRPRLTPTATASSPLLPLCARARSMHSIATLDYNKNNEILQHGIPGFMSPTAFNLSWIQYQTHCLQKLDGWVADTDLASKHVKEILLRTAREPEYAAVFNYASMVHNNHFFFKHLSPTPVQMPDVLRTHLERSFGSIETLRDEMIITASSMFGPGFVWLVKTAIPGLTPAFKILTTYGAGSPYSAAHWRRQDNDMNNAGTNSADAVEAGKQAPKRPPKKRAIYAPGGVDLHPVLCLNTWEHVWLWDFGFGVGQPTRGKFGYATEWWKKINWELVLKEANIQRHEMSADGPTLPSAGAAAA